MPELLRQWINLPERFRRVTGGQTYVPQLDGLRFFAIMPVLLWHASIRGYRSWLQMAGQAPVGEPSWMPHGEIGVDLFFVISGFVIARPFLAMVQQHRPILITRFYARRLLRLQPPYLLVLLVCALVAASGLAHDGQNLVREHGAGPWASFLASAFYLHVPLFKVPSALNPPIWSLEVEVQFYLVSPFLIGLYARLAQREMRLAAGIGAMLAAMLGGAALRASAGIFSPWSFTLATHLAGFVLGAVLADLRQRQARPRAETWGDCGFLLGLAILLISGGWELQESFPAMVLRDASRLVACAMIVDGAFSGRMAARLVGAPWIALIGSACYSIYLIHVPLMIIVWLVLGHVLPVSAAAVMPLAILLLPLVSIIAGLAFYAVVERPFMDPNWPARLTRAILPRSPQSRASL